jgi:putative iron-dependent peroxidase
MELSQPAILGDVPRCARFLTLGLGTGSDPRATLARLAELPADPARVVGLGVSLVQALGRSVDGLRPFPVISGPAGAFPSTQGALWIALTGDDPGVVLLNARRTLAALGQDLRVEEDVATFKYAGGRDLTEYEDGTENPKGEAASAAALIAGRGAGLDQGSFVAIQKYVHDLERMERLTTHERDFVMGRNRDSNEELADAPVSAHVKRAAQESYDPPAFMLRRSMPWGDAQRHGLYFIAYGATLDAFERVLLRMSGAADGVADALFGFSRPVTGGYYFCPPLRDGRLDLRALG